VIRSERNSIKNQIKRSDGKSNSDSINTRNKEDFPNSDAPLCFGKSRKRLRTTNMIIKPSLHREERKALAILNGVEIEYHGKLETCKLKQLESLFVAPLIAFGLQAPDGDKDESQIKNLSCKNSTLLIDNESALKQVELIDNRGIISNSILKEIRIPYKNGNQSQLMFVEDKDFDNDENSTNIVPKPVEDATKKTQGKLLDFLISRRETESRRIMDSRKVPKNGAYVNRSSSIRLIPFNQSAVRTRYEISLLLSKQLNPCPLKFKNTLGTYLENRDIRPRLGISKIKFDREGEPNLPNIYVWIGR